MFLYSQAIRFIIFLLPICLTFKITENRIDRGKLNFEIQDITIKSGAFWSIVDNSICTFFGSLMVEPQASLYVSLTSPILALQVAFVSILGVFHNQGNITFDSSASLTSATYRIITLTFRNTGRMFFSASGKFPNTMDIVASDWTNNGLLSFHQDQRTSGVVSLGSALGTITNNGQIKLSNQVYQQRTQISGSGCFVAINNSTIYISNSLLPVQITQSFYLADSTSSIIVDSFSATQTFNVYGFGNGNMIGLTLPLVGNYWYSSYTYDATTGILIMRNVFLEQKFNIGLGYNPSLFKIVTDWGAGIPSTILGSLSYSGCVPSRRLPSICQIDPISSLEIPGTKPTQFTSVFVSTDDSGRNGQYVGLFEVATNKNYEWVSAVIIITSIPTVTIELPPTLTLEAQWLPTVSGVLHTSSTITQSTKIGLLTTVSLVPVAETQLASRTFSIVGPPIPDTTSLELVVPTKSETRVVTESTVVPVLPPKVTHFTNSSTSNRPYSSESMVDEEFPSEPFMSDEVSIEVYESYTDESCVISTDFSVDVDYSSDLSMNFQTYDTLDTTEMFNTVENFETYDTFGTIESFDIFETSQTFESYETFNETSDLSMFSLTSELFSDLPPPLVQTDTPVSFNPVPSRTNMSEKTIMWEVTNSQGSIITESGIILISGEYQTTVTTFLRDLDQMEGYTKYTKTWEVTNSNGSVVTESGIIDESGSYHTTVTTFPQKDQNWEWAANTVEYTKTWIVTNEDGSIITESGIVGESGLYQTTVTTFPHELSSFTIYQSEEAHSPGVINAGDIELTPLATSLSIYQSVIIEDEFPSSPGNTYTDAFSPTTGHDLDLPDDTKFTPSQSSSTTVPIESEYISESIILDAGSLVSTMISPTTLTTNFPIFDSSDNQFKHVSLWDSRVSSRSIVIVSSEFPELDAPLILASPNDGLSNQTSTTASITVNDNQNVNNPEFQQGEAVISSSIDSSVSHLYYISEETSIASNNGDLSDDLEVDFILLTLLHDTISAKATLAGYSWKFYPESDEIQIDQTGDYNYSLAGAKTHIHESAYTQQDASTQKGASVQQETSIQQRVSTKQETYTQEGAQQVTRTQEKVQQGASHSTTNSHFEGTFISKTASPTNNDFTLSFEPKDNATDISNSFFAHLLIVGNSTVFETDYTDFSFIANSNTFKSDANGVDSTSNQTYSAGVGGSNVSGLISKSESVVLLIRPVMIFVFLAICVVIML